MALSPGFFGDPDKPTDLHTIASQTKAAIRFILIIGLAVIVAIILSGLLSGGGVHFVIWALIGALAATIVGGAVGVLFGLPTAQSRSNQIAIARELVASVTPATPAPQAIPTATPSTPSAPASPVVPPPPPHDVPDLDTGYRDSTSLEQIADWLTKIIVGLTLTQYASWELRFDTLARNLTEAMLGASSRSADCLAAIAPLNAAAKVIALNLPLCQVPAPSAIPGGTLIALFATAGFLVSYLWMRRYFILEMVIARKEAIDLLKLKNAETTTTVYAENQAQTVSLLEIERSKADKLKAESENLKAEVERLAAQAALRQAEDEAKMAEAEKHRLAALDQGRAQTTSDLRPVEDSWPSQILRRAKDLLPAESEGVKALTRVQKAVADEPTDPEDPWRNKFGGQAISGDKALEATVVPTADPKTFRIDIAVRSLADPLPADLVGDKVVFFLHPTFGDEPRVSSIGADGKAPLVLYAYGAFTTGVVLEDGTTLEINLATLESAPADFRSR